MRAFLSSRTLDLSTKKLGGKSYANRTDAKNGRIVSNGVNNRRRYYFEQLKFTRDENLYFFRKKRRKGRKERKRKEKEKENRALCLEIFLEHFHKSVKGRGVRCVWKENKMVRVDKG